VLLCCSCAADRVKQIKTDARINHVQTDKLIAALIAEKEKLLRDLEAANRSGTPTDGFTNDGDCLFVVNVRRQQLYETHVDLLLMDQPGHSG